MVLQRAPVRQEANFILAQIIPTTSVHSPLVAPTSQLHLLHRSINTIHTEEAIIITTRAAATSINMAVLLTQLGRRLVLWVLCQPTLPQEALSSSSWPSN